MVKYFKYFIDTKIIIIIISPTPPNKKRENSILVIHLKKIKIFYYFYLKFSINSQNKIYSKFLTRGNGRSAEDGYVLRTQVLRRMLK